MHKSNKFTYANILQINFDIFFLILTYTVAYLIACQLTTMHSITEYLWILIIFIPIWISIMAFLGMFDKTTFYYLDRVLRNVAIASFFSGVSLGTMFFFIKETSISRLFIGTFFLLCIAIMSLERCVFSKIYRRGNTNKFTPRIVVVCSQLTFFSFKQYLKKTHIRYNIVGTVQFDEQEANQDDQFKLDSLANLGDILKNQVVDEVVLAMPSDYNGVEQYISLCEKLGITVHLVLNYFNLKTSHVHISMLGPLPVVTFNTVTLNPFQKITKRMMDIAGALVGISITIFAAVFIIPAIMLDSPGSVVFEQKRVGRYGRVFNLYKFRTMCVDAEVKKEELLAMNEHRDGMMFKIKEDPRITRVGAFLRKTSLDELPQFFNVLKGDMSLVGTRPPTLDEVARYDFDHLRRISIKPGVTGMWQVNGRSNITDFDEVVALDVWYIDNWSIWLDINILLKTVGQVVGTKSAY